MTYGLRRLRLRGLIERVPHTNTYLTTPEGIRAAVFFTKLHRHLLAPLLEADKPPASPELRQALRTIDTALRNYVKGAWLGLPPDGRICARETCHLVKRSTAQEELAGQANGNVSLELVRLLFAGELAPQGGINGSIKASDVSLDCRWQALRVAAILLDRRGAAGPLCTATQ
jgi:hypothetical protein